MSAAWVLQEGPAQGLEAGSSCPAPLTLSRDMLPALARQAAPGPGSGAALSEDQEGYPGPALRLKEKALEARGGGQTLQRYNQHQAGWWE